MAQPHILAIPEKGRTETEMPLRRYDKVNLFMRETLNL